MGWEDAKDDYAVLDGEKSVGRIYKECGEAKWFCSVNTAPFAAPPLNNGLAIGGKQQFRQRYEEIKARGVRPFFERMALRALGGLTRSRPPASITRLSISATV
jgi:hypothetical protein